MYIISAVVDKAQCKVVLYDQEYKLAASKIGAASEPFALCLDLVKEAGASLCDVQYAGVAVDPAAGDYNSVAAELSGKLGVPCYGATVMNARALAEAYLADVSSLMMIKATTAANEFNENTPANRLGCYFYRFFQSRTD